jgi:hypothetical protein
MDDDYGFIKDFMFDTEELIPITRSIDEISDEMDKILNFDYKWYYWRHIDIMKTNLIQLDDFKNNLKKVKLNLKNDIQKIDDIRLIRVYERKIEIIDNKFESIKHKEKKMENIVLCYEVSGKL